jgi:hypothetical protein
MKKTRFTEEQSSFALRQAETAHNGRLPYISVLCDAE